MLVTDIKKIDDKRSCLYLDYEAFGPLYASDIRRLKLTVGSETDAEKMQQFRSEYFFKRAMNKAVTAIKYSEKCEYDIRQKLKELCYDEEVIDTTLDKLKKYKYIDDARYASVYVRSHIQGKADERSHMHCHPRKYWMNGSNRHLKKISFRMKERS